MTAAPAPTAQALVTETAAAEPLTAAALAPHTKAWKRRRAELQQAVLRGMNPEQTQAVAALLAAHREECLIAGLGMGIEAEKRAARWANSRANELLKQAAEDNAALRARADNAEKALASLRASLPGVERVVRGQIIAAAPADYPALPRVKPGSGVHYRFLSHPRHIARIARRIEEFIAGPPNRGICTRADLDAELLPETPAAAYQQAINHLLLSNRIKKLDGAYRLSRGRP